MKQKCGKHKGLKKKNLGQPTAFISAYSGGKVKENGMYVASDQTVIQFKKKMHHASSTRTIINISKRI